LLEPGLVAARRVLGVRETACEPQGGQRSRTRTRSLPPCASPGQTRLLLSHTRRCAYTCTRSVSLGRAAAPSGSLRAGFIKV